MNKQEHICEYFLSQSEQSSEHHPFFDLTPDHLLKISDQIQQQQEPNQSQQNKTFELKSFKPSKKLERKKKIRTGRNAHKIYHNILKQWFSKNGCSRILTKYSQYYNKRIYFPLLLNQVQKKISGDKFAQYYSEMAQDVIKSKIFQIQKANHFSDSSQYAKHQERVIQEIQFSIESCQLFMEGRIMDSITTVFLRKQKKITKKKQFLASLEIFNQITGIELQTT